MELMNNEQAIKDKEAAKMKKYQHIKSVSNLTFIPFVVDEHGMFGSCANQIIEKIARTLDQTAEQKTCFRKYWEKQIRSAYRKGIMSHRLERQNRCSPFHSALCDIQNRHETNQHLSFSSTIQSNFPQFLFPPDLATPPIAAR